MVIEARRTACSLDCFDACGIVAEVESRQPKAGVPRARSSDRITLLSLEDFTRHFTEWPGE